MIALFLRFLYILILFSMKYYNYHDALIDVLYPTFYQWHLFVDWTPSIEIHISLMLCWVHVYMHITYSTVLRH